MRVIGTDGNKKCIVECSYDEMANLLGHYSQYSEGFTLKELMGKNIPVGKIYNQLRERTYVKSRMAEARKKLEETLAGLREIEPEILDIVEDVQK